MSKTLFSNTSFTGARSPAITPRDHPRRTNRTLKEALAVVDHQVPASPTDRAMLSAASPCSTPCAFGRYGRAVPTTVVEPITHTSPRATPAACCSAAAEPSMHSGRASRSTSSPSSNGARRPPSVDAVPAHIPVHHARGRSYASAAAALLLAELHPRARVAWHQL